MPKRKRFGVAFALLVIAKGEALKQSPPDIYHLTAHCSWLIACKSSANVILLHKIYCIFM
jgi:hypothetical protein